MRNILLEEQRDTHNPISLKFSSIINVFIKSRFLFSIPLNTISLKLLSKGITPEIVNKLSNKMDEIKVELNANKTTLNKNYKK